MASGRPDWHSIITISGREGTTFRPIKVDADGQMYIAMTGQTIDVDNLPIDYFKTGQDVGRIKGDDDDTPRLVAVDASGILLSRMKGSAFGDITLHILDDCGDNDAVVNWVRNSDALDPLENKVYVKQGSTSVKLQIDASASAQDYGLWINSRDLGDLSAYQNNWAYLWVYFDTLDYLLAEGTAFQYWMGTDSNNHYRWFFTKANLVLGWNLIKCDFNDPDYVKGAQNWANCQYQRLYVTELVDNTNDFTLYVDSIKIVRPSTSAGYLRDIGVDEQGIMLSKMAGEYGGVLKTLAIDADGLMLSIMKGNFGGTLKTIEVDTDGMMKANLSAQGLDFIYQKPLYTEQKLAQDIHFNFGGVGTRDCITINGSGIVLSGYVWFYGNVANDPTVILSVDDVQCESMLLSQGIERNRTAPSSGNLFLTRYDELEDQACVGISPGITFETKLMIKVHNPVAGAIEGDVILNYALVPERP